MTERRRNTSGAPSGWYRDPTLRHQYRYFDGVQWTDHVANEGVTATDMPDSNLSAPSPDMVPKLPPGQTTNGSHAWREPAAGAAQRQGFVRNVALCFERFATFNARAPRPEFWWFFVFRMIVFFVAAFFGAAYGGEDGAFQLTSIMFLVLLLPYLAVSVRRLHDVGLSGWLVLLELVPLLGSVALLILMALPTVEQTNRWGPPPTR